MTTKKKTLSLCIVILAFLLSSMTHLSDPNETAMRNLPYSLLLKHIYKDTSYGMRLFYNCQRGFIPIRLCPLFLFNPLALHGI